MRSPIVWFGGKGSAKIKRAILAALPAHKFYVEPFGGGASILLSKQPVEVEVYNDVNRGLVNFFRVIADPETFPRFLGRAMLLPVSRELFEEFARTWAGIHDPVEQAVRWFVVARQSFSGIFGNAWGVTFQSSTAGMAHSASGWLSAIKNLPDVHTRMQRVQIECCDWRDCLKRYDGQDWLAYCDPPYVSGTRKAGGYAHELRDRDHAEMVQALLAYKGAAVLSGYPNALYAPLERAGWDRIDIQVVCSAAGRTRASGLMGDGGASAKQQRTECLWRNPRCQQAAPLT